MLTEQHTKNGETNWINCGQTCIAPDYILVKSEFKKDLIHAIINEIKKAFGNDASKSNDYGRIIHNFKKLESE